MVVVAAPASEVVLQRRVGTRDDVAGACTADQRINVLGHRLALGLLMDHRSVPIAPEHLHLAPLGRRAVPRRLPLVLRAHGEAGHTGGGVGWGGEGDALVGTHVKAVSSLSRSL